MQKRGRESAAHVSVEEPAEGDSDFGIQANEVGSPEPKNNGRDLRDPRIIQELKEELVDVKEALVRTSMELALFKKRKI